MAYGIIYKIVNQLDGKPYVGQTVRSLEERFQEHAKADSYIGNAIRAHGVENFTCEVIEECDTREQLNEREIFWIAELNCKHPNGYNLTDGGEGTSGHSHSEETKAKIGAKHKGIPRSPETRAKLSAANRGENNPNYGKHPSDETLAKMSAANSGENHPMYGKHHTDATRAKISESKMGQGKGVPKSPEHRAKIGAANSGENNYLYGKHHTDETRAKISAAEKGEKAYWFGKHHANETCAKISATLRKESPYKNLLAEMDARQITYHGLATLLGLSGHVSVSRKMRGERNFTAEQIAKLAEIFGKPVDYLLARD